jgi:hypothetical protein
MSGIAKEAWEAEVDQRARRPGLVLLRTEWRKLLDSSSYLRPKVSVSTLCLRFSLVIDK